MNLGPGSSRDRERPGPALFVLADCAAAVRTWIPATGAPSPGMMFASHGRVGGAAEDSSARGRSRTAN
jgi:hypothetical protein